MDRNLYKSDKKMASRGWRAMRRTLDREMPEERRRRPVALFWILSLLAPAGGLLGWYLIGQGYIPSGQLPETSISRPSIPQRQDQQIALHSEPAPQEHSTTPSGKVRKSEPRKTAPAMKRKKGAGPTSGSDLPSGGAAEKIRSEGRTIMAEAVSQPAETTILPTQSPATQDIAAQSSSVPPTPNESAPEISTPESSAASTPYAAGAEQPSPPVVLPDASPLAANLNNEQFTLPPKPIDPLRPAHKTWAFATSAGVLSDTKGAYAGTGAGLNAEWQPLKKWGLRSGIGYQFRQLSAEERPVLSISTSNYVDVTGDTRVAAANTNFGSSAAQGDNAPVWVPVARLHRVEVPVVAFWQPSSKIRLFGGISIGSNLYAETGNRSLSNNIVYDIQGAATKDLNSEVSGQVREWDTRLSFGLGFKPLRQMEIGLFFHQPIGENKLWNNQAEKLNSNGQYQPGNVQDFYGNSTPNQSKINASALLNLTASWFF